MTASAPRPASPLIDELLGRCRFPEAGTSVTCAVSGGPDSTALLILAAAADLVVTAVHVDHGLRSGSAADASVVAAAAERFGAAFVARTVVVGDGPNLEDRARRARLGVLPADVLTGHTLDDQAETVLMFLLRGAGPDGLAGIDPSRRPLLGLRRAETSRLCEELGVAVVVDPSNSDPRFVRNRIRHELLPLMDHIADRDVAPLIARTADLQRDVLAVVGAATTGLDPTDARAVSSLPPAVASALLREWWKSTTGSSYAPDAAATTRMLDVAAGRASGADVTGGWRLARTDQRLRLVPPLGTDALGG